DFIWNGDRVRGVATTGGPIEAETTVIAAGPLSGPLASRAHLDVPLATVRRQKLIIPDLAAVPAQAPMTIDFETGAHWRPAGNSGHGIMGSIGGSRRAVDAITATLLPGANPFRPDRPMATRSFDIL